MPTTRPEIPFHFKLRNVELLRDSPRRESLYAAIRASPGIHFVELQKGVPGPPGRPRIACGVLTYHLSRMEKVGMIVSKREGRYRRYFDVASNLGADAARVALLQTAPVPVLARAILERPGLTQSELLQAVSDTLGSTRQALTYHLQRLVQKELVTIENLGRHRRYRPTERLVRLARFLGPSTSPMESLSAGASSVSPGPLPA